MKVTSGVVTLSLSHMDKLTQQNQEDDATLPCGLPVMFHVLFCCTGRQEGLYLGPSALLEESPWSSEVLRYLCLLMRLGR